MKKIYLNTLTPEETIARLEKGDVLKDEKNKRQLWMWKNNLLFESIVEDDGQKLYYINTTFCTGDRDYYFEEEEKFEITETGLYRTRDGRKAFVSCIEDTDDDGNPKEFPCRGVIEDETYIRHWRYNGRMDVYELQRDVDLVGKWEK